MSTISLNTGAPHFKSLMKQHRHADYTLAKVLNEFIDNVIKKTDKIVINTQVDDGGKLLEITISDNYIHGFENLDCEGNKNPFNMGHIKGAHEDDSETSEFGVGMKAGSLTAAIKLNVYTKIMQPDGSALYVEVICDFIKMSNEQDVNSSYNPRIRHISEADYKEYHPFEQGSTLLLSNIRDCIYSIKKQELLTIEIVKGIADTYSRFIERGTSITVNGVQVTAYYDFFEDPKCNPFSTYKELFVLKKSGLSLYFIRQTTAEGNINWKEYSREKEKWVELKVSNGVTHIRNLLENDYISPYASINYDGAVMEINTTFVFYSNKFHNESSDECCFDDDEENVESNPLLPEDAAFIYKDDRNYGKKSLFKHNNGSNNYTLHEIDFKSKCLGKDLGITFSKEINMSGNNDLINVIKSALKDSRMGLTSDTSTAANAKLCQTAIDRGLIDPLTCNLRKLSKKHREIFGRGKKESSSSENLVEPEKNSQLNKSKIVFAKNSGIKKVPKTQVEEPQVEEPQVEEPQVEVEEQVEEQQNLDDGECYVFSDGFYSQNSNLVLSTLDIRTDHKELVEIIEDENSQLDSNSEVDETLVEITNQHFCVYEVRRNRIQIVINKLRNILDGSDNNLLSDQEILAIENFLL